MEILTVLRTKIATNITNYVNHVNHTIEYYATIKSLLYKIQH
jgi:hypothetical protein